MFRKLTIQGLLLGFLIVFSNSPRAFGQIDQTSYGLYRDGIGKRSAAVNGLKACQIDEAYHSLNQALDSLEGALEIKGTQPDSGVSIQALIVTLGIVSSKTTGYNNPTKELEANSKSYVYKERSVNDEELIKQLFEVSALLGQINTAYDYYQLLYPNQTDRYQFSQTYHIRRKWFVNRGEKCTRPKIARLFLYQGWAQLREASSGATSDLRATNATLLNAIKLFSEGRDYDEHNLELLHGLKNAHALLGEETTAQYYASLIWPQATEQELKNAVEIATDQFSSNI